MDDEGREGTGEPGSHEEEVEVVTGLRDHEGVVGVMM